MLRDEALADRIAEDPTNAGLDERRTAMLAYAEKLTCFPAAIVEADLNQLRAAGFSDADLLAVAETTAYYAYVNRIAQGLGVGLE